MLRSRGVRKPGRGELQLRPAAGIIPNVLPGGGLRNLLENISRRERDQRENITAKNLFSPFSLSSFLLYFFPSPGFVPVSRTSLSLARTLSRPRLLLPLLLPLRPGQKLSFRRSRTVSYRFHLGKRIFPLSLERCFPRSFSTENTLS